ncbi:MAG: RidA family protein [Caulobacterales bacterium]
MTVQKLNPPQIAKPVAHYSHLAVVPEGHRLLILSGQVGSAADGGFPDVLEAQFELALANALAVAAAEGAGPDDVAKVTYYLTERPTDLRRIGTAIRAAFPGTPPASTFLIISGLAGPQMKVEVEIVAAVKA